jgi:hypothetical protein
LQRCEQCAGHDHAAQAPSHAQADDGRTNDEPPEHNERDHEQRTRDRKTRPEEIDREERAAARHRDRVQAIMHVEQIDGAVAEKATGQGPTKEYQWPLNIGGEATSWPITRIDRRHDLGEECTQSGGRE